MAQVEENLVSDPLFLACTRPAMFYGVPFEAVGLNMMASSTVFISISGSGIIPMLCVIGSAVAIHYIFKQIVKRDYNRFKVLFAYLETKGRAKNFTYWGGSSSSPLRVSRTYSYKDFE